MIDRRSLLCVILAAAGPASAEEFVPLPGASVGMPIRIESLVLDGPELEAVPLDDREAPVVLRIIRVYPHGSAFRYDLEAYGLEPGTFDLRAWLRRRDGSSTAELPPIPVEVRATLPPGQLEPNALIPRATPRPGGYRTALIVGAIAWVASLGALLFAGHRRRRLAEARAARPVTLADRLRPLVVGAIAGSLDPAGRAELERLLIGYWRRRVGLEELDPPRAVAILREHEEAGPVLRRLEDWLHRPPGTAAEEVDLSALLEPYRDLPADALEPSAPETLGKGA